MTISVIKTSFATGEISPSLFGHVDLEKFASAASTMRNCYVNYRGGAYSRPGTAFVGYSKQTGRSFPPRLIPFQFSISQGLVLEFGNQYMRVVVNGGYVTESTVNITGVTQANPAVVTVSSTYSGETASPNNGAVSVSYAPGNLISLAGGVYTSPAVLSVTNTLLLSCAVNAPGTGYAPGNRITLAGGTQTSAALLTVGATQVVSATVGSAGTGGTNGSFVVTGTTGTGTKFQANVTISGNAISAVNSIAVAGVYTVNPTSPDPVTGGGLSGATLVPVMGVQSISITSGGVFTANAAGGTFTQAATSGSGTGATFQSALFGPNAVSFSSYGSYTSFPPNPVAQYSATGGGRGVTFNVTTTASAPYVNGDWVYISGVGGMTQLNGRTFVIGSASSTGFTLFDVFGNNINSVGYAAYGSGGTAARIYTLPTPYSDADLEWIKYDQSADVMSLTCWNQNTLAEYQPLDLQRYSDSSWTLASPQFAETVAPPASASGTTSSSGSAYYAFQVTAVSPSDGSESVASPIAVIPSSVDIGTVAGALTISWAGVTGVNQYNIYKAEPGYGSAVPIGALFGYAGSAYGTQFIDSNIVPDFSQVPPQHQNPFARGQLVASQVTAQGSGYTSATLTITTSTGSGAVLVPVLQGGALEAIIVENTGSGYAVTDTIAVSGPGTGATAVLNIGPETGTYPGVISYFQERRVYASTINNPDTYFMSIPGAYANFDVRTPTLASDAITGTPWSVQVNGIQFMVSMPGGLVVFTGLSAWQLTGAGGSSLNPQPITPANQQAQPQAYNGCSATVPPIKIDYQIIYLQAKGSIYREFSYQFFTNIYTGADLTQMSSHLFSGYTIREHAWCEEPNKILWAVRNDGVLLSLTYLKPQEVMGWARHDTQGDYQSVCSVTEAPVDALYLCTARTVGAQLSYMVERQDNRQWTTAETCWCVDAGLSLPQGQPGQTLNASTASGNGVLTGVTGLVNGQNYSSATTAVIVDANGLGPGTGAVIAVTVVSGAVTALSFTSGGTGYTYPQIVITDPTNAGSGASARATLQTQVTFYTASPMFSTANVGSVIRMGGGVGTIVTYVNSTSVVANMTSPITDLLRDGVGTVVRPQAAGTWTMTTPTTVVSGLYHLIGAMVTGLADGNVVPPTAVASDGTVTLPAPASSVILGLGFTAQVQSVYLEVGPPTVQGRRKRIPAVTARFEASRGLQCGVNQIDGSAVSPTQIAPIWANLDTMPDKGAGSYNATFTPLFTGDNRITTKGGFDTPGQVAIQQVNPLPLQLLSLEPEFLEGDLAQTQFPSQQPRGGR